ncbi:prepilin peptidase [Pannus brasiliensis CCIBt3594]|uniref:Prepilin leader peptidase/N-methyltransferase n=1 Tax=Pannus brasiliensis CCIBt3594 TaxID=1427578 RepID=A0AAW9QWQ0_9CHRO
MEFLLDLFTTGFVFAWGACVGSFLNVVVYRLPNGMSIVHPPSHCPKCSHRLGKTENVPVVGWLWLRGRCRWCKTEISFRYPAIEFVTGLLFCYVFQDFAFSLDTIGYWIFLSWLLALALIDLDTMTLPEALTRSGLLLGLVFQFALGWQNQQGASYLFGALLSAAVGIWCFDLVRFGATLILGKEAMGGGDPKLAAMIGAWLGWQSLLVTTFVACLIGSAIGLLGIVLGKRRWLQEMPFGPYLSLGALVSLFWGKAIVSTYLTLFFPTF